MSNKPHVSVLNDALKEKKPVLAFNYSDCWEYAAIVEAAAEVNATVYTASNECTVNTIGLDYCAAYGKITYESSRGKIINHLDHAKTIGLCKAAVNAGYHSVMFDGSMLPIKENIALTKEVVSYAHAHGVAVEAEVGVVFGNNEESNAKRDDTALATPEHCVRLIEETKVDSLAVGIGTAHGFYAQAPQLNIQLLKEIRALTSIPLVLHGGTGLPAESVRECLACGITKVNVGTELHGAYKRALVAELKRNPSGTVLAESFLPVKEAVKEVVKNWIKMCNA